MRGCLFLHMKNCGIKAKIVKTERDRQTEIDLSESASAK